MICRAGQHELTRTTRNKAPGLRGLLLLGHQENAPLTRQSTGRFAWGFVLTLEKRRCKHRTYAGQGREIILPAAAG